MHRTARLTAAFLSFILVSLAGTAVPIASAAITPNNAQALAHALTRAANLPVTGSFVAPAATGTPNAVADSALAGFPRDGNTFAILTTGDANLADDPNSGGSSGATAGGASTRGGAIDTTILKVDLLVPSGHNCLTIDFRFLSEEFPEYVGSQFNDAFVAELDTDSWSISAGTINAPNNFAFDGSNQPITINTTGSIGMDDVNAAGTTYDGATPVLQASTPVTAGAHSLYLSIFDQGDSGYDSAVFVDALSTGSTSGEGSCQPGAVLPISDISLTTPDTVTPPGIDDAPLATLPAQELPQQTPPDETAPIGRAPIGRAPIGRAPIGRAPIGRAPIGRAPIGRAPIGRAPIGRAPIGRALLASYPLNVPGGWTEVLQETSLYPADTPQGVTLFQLFSDPFATDGNPATLSQLDPACAGEEGATTPPAPCTAFALELADFNVAGSPLENVPLLAFLLGDLTWDDVTPPAGGWCSEWSQVSSLPCDLSRTIFDTAAEGFPIDRTSLPVRTIGDLEDPSRTRAVFWSLTTADLNMPPSLCTPMVCNDPDTTLADLGAALNGLTLSDVVLMVVDPVALDWEQLPLLDAGLEGIDPSPANFVNYDLDFMIGCPAASGLTASVTLPPDFRYRPGSSEVTVDPGEGAVAQSIGDPVAGETGALVWDLGGVTCPVEGEAAAIRVEFQAMPGLTLGTFGASAAVSADDVAATVAADQAPVTVADLGEGTLNADVNTLYVGHLGGAGEIDTFDVSVPVGHTLSVTLSQLSDGHDYDLALYAPDGSDIAGLLRSPGSVVEVAGGALATDPPDPTGRVLAPPALEGISLDEGRPVAGISSLRGTEQEGITTTAVAGDEGSTYTVQVSGHNGAFGNSPYVLIIRDVEAYAIPQCIDAAITATPTSSTHAALPSAAGAETLYVVDEGAMKDAFGTTSAGQITAALGSLASTPEGDGVVVPIDHHAGADAALDAYRDDPCSVEAANDAVEAVNQAIDSLTGVNGVENVVLVGDDAIFPHAGLPDGTVDGNESGYIGDLVFADASGQARSNHLTAVLADNGFLSDTPYATPHPLSILGQIVYVPQWGFGRLAGGASDILGAITRFDSSNGAADPSSAVTAPRRVLETDYDFMTDGGEAIFSRLQSQVGAANAVRLFGNWTRADFLQQFLQATNKPHVVSANAHYDHHRMLPGLGNATGDESVLVDTGDVAAASGLAYRILFSIGCHFALGVPNSYAPGPDNAERRLDWAEAYAQAGVAAMIGKLGYGYGDTATVGFDERLMGDVAANLDGSMSIGEALNAAEHRYLSSASALSPYDFKILQDTVLWGLPMYRPTGAVATASAALAASSLPTPTQDPQTGNLYTTSASLSTTFTKRTLSDGRSFYEADGGLTDALHPYPVMPKAVTALPPGPSGHVAHGAVPLALTRQAESLDIAFANATVDSSALEPATAYETVYPITSRIGTSVASDGSPSQNLVVIPAEFTSDDDLTNSPSIGTFGRYTASQWLVTYGPANGEFTPPATDQIVVTPSGSAFEISAHVTDDSGVARVFALVLKGDGTFARIELTDPNDDDVYTGTTATGISVRGVSVYAIDGAGNTAAAHDKRLGFVAESAHGDSVKPTIQIFTPPSPAAIYDVNEVVTESYTCSDDVTPEPTCTDSNSGTTLNTATTGSKVFTVTSMDDDGNTATVGRSYFVRFEGFQGLFAPVDPLPRLNVARAGQVVPLKWRIVDANGQPITNASHFVSVTSAVFGACSGVSDTIESYSGGSGLQYLGNGYWQFNWKTQKAWKGSCREVVVNLADGTPGGRGYVAAQFRFS